MEHAKTKDKTMTGLQTAYNNAVNAYIKEFEKNYDVTFDFWVADETGTIAMIGDEAYDFHDIKYMVDNAINYDWLHDWYYFCVEYQKCYINLDSYCRLRRDAEKNEYFNNHSFEKSLLYMRLK